MFLFVNSKWKLTLLLPITNNIFIRAALLNRDEFRSAMGFPPALLCASDRYSLKTSGPQSLNSYFSEDKPTPCCPTHLILCLLMSSMVKVEYSLSSWCSCCDWLLVRMPYMGTDTNWIRIWSSGDVLSYNRWLIFV